MIFVAVGTQKFPFHRLLRSVDEIVGRGVEQEEVFAQIGYSNYMPLNYKYTEFLSGEEYSRYIRECSLMITHSGVATIIAGLRNKKPVIVMPRLARYGEHVDDHQVQIATSFATKNMILQCGEHDDLEELIVKARTYPFREYVSQREYMIQTIKEYIRTI